MDYHFFATVSRMKYIERWALMRNARAENLSEHAVDVAVIAHALCVIGNVRYGMKLDGEKACLIGLYHDAEEIITGDMPTPVKYYNETIRSSYKEVEKIAQKQLLSQLPDDLKGEYEKIFSSTTEEELLLHRYVKAADKLSALIKCIEERSAGNTEFITAEESTRKALEEMAEEIPAVRDFMEEFLPSYGKTLDQLLER